MSTKLTLEQEKQIQERIKDAERNCIAWVLKIMKDHFGDEAYHVLVKTRGEKICTEWKRKAEEGNDNSIEALIKHLWEPLKDYGFEYTMEKTESGFQMRCTKCPEFDFAKRDGITEQMYYMACESDPYIVEGFNPNIGLTRTKTLMEGDDCCDHFYYYKNNEQS